MRKGIPVSARFPTIREVVVNGRSLKRPPIFRISCSLFKLWMIDPEHRNNIALKNACVQICRKAK